MAELGQAGNITRAGGSSIAESGGGALLDFGSVRVRIPAGAQLRLDAVDTQLVRVDTEDGRVDLCVLAAPRSSSLWARMSREVAASQASKGAQVYTERGEWGDEVLSAKDGRLSRYVATDGPGWMLFGLANGAEETSVELADTLRSMMQSCLVRRGNEPLPEKTPLPITVPPGLSRADESSAESSRFDSAEPGAERSSGRQAGPVFQLGPSGTTRRARTAASGHGPATRPSSMTRHGSATRHGSTAPSGPSRDNRAPAAAGPASIPDRRPNRWIRAGQVSLALGVVACLAVMVGWLLNGSDAGQVHYTPAVAQPPNAAAPAPGDALALGNVPEAPGGPSAEGQSSRSVPGQESAPGPGSKPTRSTPGRAESGATPATGAKRPVQHPTGHQPATRAAQAPARSGRPAVHAPAESVAGHGSTGQSERSHSSDDARDNRDDDGDGGDSNSHSDDSDRHDHSDRDDGDRPAGPLNGVTRTLDGIGLGLGH